MMSNDLAIILFGHHISAKKPLYMFCGGLEVNMQFPSDFRDRKFRLLAEKIDNFNAPVVRKPPDYLVEKSKIHIPVFSRILE
jgi:hypothetical protein